MRSLFDNIDGLDAKKMLGLKINVPVGRAYKEVLGVLSDIPFQNLFKLLITPATQGEQPIYIIEMILKDEQSVVYMSKIQELVESDVTDGLSNLISKFVERFGDLRKVLVTDLIQKLKETGASEIIHLGFEAVFQRDDIWWIRYIGDNGKVVFESSESTDYGSATALLEQRKHQKE